MPHTLYRLLAGFDQERARRFGLKAAILAYGIARLSPRNREVPAMPVDVMGLRFPNPVGMAAGLDRTGELYTHLRPGGFGFMELGTMNVGSPAKALTFTGSIPWRGAFRPEQSDRRPLLGISLGSLRAQFDEQMQEDYMQGLEAVHAHADYITLNLSRPHSAVRAGHIKRKQLAAFMDSMVQTRQKLASKQYCPPPLLIKAAILENERETITPLLHLARETGLNGFIAAFEQWRSTDDMCRRIEQMARYLDPIPLIAVGGIRTAEDVRLRLEAGAALVQLYHAFMEHGPFVARKIVNDLLALPQLTQVADSEEHLPPAIDGSRISHIRQYTAPQPIVYNPD